MEVIVKMSSLSLMVVLFLQVLSASFTAVAAQPTPELGSALVFRLTGNVYPQRYFELSLGIGNPPQSFTFKLDTGNPLTWVQCDANCQGCNLPRDKLYKPGKAAVILPADPICIEFRNPRSKDPKRCDVLLSYGDGLNTSGYLLTDTFSWSSSPTPAITFAFMCGNKIQIPPTISLETAGILGLGKNVGSFPSQLRAAGVVRQNVVGHCLGVNGGGYLFIGADPVPPSGVTWTPMLKGAYYESGPAHLFFDGKPTASLDGVLFDSGTTYSGFPSQIYEPILTRVSENLIGTPFKPIPSRKDFAVCWKHEQLFKSLSEVRGYFKTFTMSFTNAKLKADLQLPPENYLVIPEPGIVCLGILEEDQLAEENSGLLGAISMLDKTIIYDNEKSQIGWISCFTPTS